MTDLEPAAGVVAEQHAALGGSRVKLLHGGVIESTQTVHVTGVGPGRRVCGMARISLPDPIRPISTGNTDARACREQPPRGVTQHAFEIFGARRKQRHEPHLPGLHIDRIHTVEDQRVKNARSS